MIAMTTPKSVRFRDTAHSPEPARDPEAIARDRQVQDLVHRFAWECDTLSVAVLYDHLLSDSPVSLWVIAGRFDRSLYDTRAVRDAVRGRLGRFFRRLGYDAP